MNKSLQAHEREIVKLAKFFSKKAAQLIQESKLTEEHQQVSEACEKLILQLNDHAENRALVHQKRETLKTLIKDNAQCPQCHKSTHLKHVNIDTNEKGWKCNRYRCRRCNIQFTWNRPNNPWDMISSIEDSTHKLEIHLQQETLSEQQQQETQETIRQMRNGLEQLKTVVEKMDKEFEEMQVRDQEMISLISDFRKYLLIEKIKLGA